jgi:ribonuclease HII
MSKLSLNKIINSVGLDEAGRGAWAGPVVAAAVYINSDTNINGIDDSKKLSPVKREKLYDLIMANHVVGIGIANVKEIDELNILQATILAMKRSLENLAYSPDLVLVDGNYNPNLGVKSEAIIGGDAKYESIAAASIIAKVTRDRILKKMSIEFPGYSWDKNFGYGTKDHIKGLDSLGVNEHHRKTYKPIKDRVELRLFDFV